MSTTDQPTAAPTNPALTSPAHTSPAPDDRIPSLGPASFAVRISDADLEPEPLDPAQIVSGTPRVTGKVLWESPDGKQIRGIWQITPGVVTDTEADELFVVVEGRATVEVEGGETLEIGPGDACVLRAGDRTTWTVHETLRKAYHISL
ncbi:cupin domain-containing protein [Streptomyces sp. NPDC006530]|uniref:cupin domain-containing protein n=1 Tax=Streptomyces sp. NPDC006530 TaxID=3364750 RepID=UPI003697ABD2